MAILGEASERKTGQRETLTLSSLERAQGTYIIGNTGTGKSTLLKNIIIDDLWNSPGEGICVLDPHGDLVQEILAWIPEERINDVVYLDPMDTDQPFGLNLLACDRSSEHEIRWVVSTIMETLKRLFFYSWGPRLEHVLHHAIRTSLVIPGSTLVDLLLLLNNREYRESIVGSEDETGILDPRRDQLLIDFWHNWFHPLGERQQAEIVSSTVNKLSPFLLDSMMRNIVGQTTSSFDLRAIMDEGKILLVNLAKGDIGEVNSALLGSVLVNLVLIGGFRRSQPQRTFHLIVDEYQNFASQSFSVLQGEARKFGIDLIVAHQYRDQLDRESMGASLNTGNLITFRISGRDAYALASQFNNSPPPPDTKMENVMVPLELEAGDFFTPYEGQYGTRVYEELELPRRPYNDVEAEMANNLSTLSNYQAYCRLIRRPEKGIPFLAEYLLETHSKPAFGKQSSDIKSECVRVSRLRYGRERAAVEAEIFERTGGRFGDPVIPPDVPASGAPISLDE